MTRGAPDESRRVRKNANRSRQKGLFSTYHQHEAWMRRKSVPHLCTVAVVFLLSASCSVGPTENDIDEFLENTLESVNGAWTGTIGANQATLTFNLTQTGGSVSGSGTMKETAAASSVPITITGTFQRPVLSLTFNGMVFEGTNVQGTAQGSYSTVAGISTAIRLVGTSYDKTLQLHIYEQ